MSQEIADELARLEEEFWRKVIPRLCRHISTARQPLGSPETLEAVRRIADATAKEVFNAKMRG